MAIVVFYEKPGCTNNTRQKRWLRESGHQVLARNLLAHKWRSDELIRFLAELPVAKWFNPNAPRVKSGEINPAELDTDRALALLQAEPLLIRRPLMQVGESRMAGFDHESVARWIGLCPRNQAVDLEACSRAGTDMMMVQGE